MNEANDPDMFLGKGLKVADESINEDWGTTINGGVKNADEVQFRVLHEALTATLRLLGRSGEETRVEVSVGKKKKAKDLRDITDKLVACPVKLKPNWAGPKLTSRTSKEASNIK